MRRIFYALIIVCTLVSCAESYSVQGSSSVSALDGSKLYLKAIKDHELKDSSALLDYLTLSAWPTFSWTMRALCP